MAKRRARRDAEERREKKPRSRWKFIVAGGFLLSLGLLFFTPTIVAKTSLRQRIVPLLLPEFQGRADIGSASLGWFSPVELRDVSIVNAQGQPLLEATSITTEKSLLSLIGDTSQLGTIVIQQPHMHLHVRDDGSNLEDAIEPLLEPSDDSQSVSVAVKVSDGQVDVQESASGQSWSWQSVNAELTLPSDPDSPLEATIGGDVKAAETSGRLDAQLTCQQSEAGLGSGKVKLETDALPLEMLQSIVRRWVDGAKVGGLLTTSCELSWDDDASSQTWNITDFTAQNLVCAAPQWLGADELRFNLVTTSGTAVYADGRVDISEFKFDSDLANLYASGSFAVADLSAEKVLDAIQREDFRVGGEVDLARLAAALPDTFRIRDDMKITSGRMTLSAFSRMEQGQRRMVANIETSNVAGEADGRVITWERPIRLVLDASLTDEGPVIDKLSCESSFFDVQASGRLTSGHLKATADLDQLVTELARFIELDGYRFTGTMTADVGWRPVAANALPDAGAADLSQGQRLQSVASGTIVLKDFEVTLPNGQPWRDDELVITLNATGVADQDGLHRLDKGTVRVQSGDDLLTASLTEPVAKFDQEARLPVRCHLVGDLRAWLRRIRPWVSIDGWDFGGGADITAQMTLRASQWDIQKANVTFKPFEATAEGIAIAEQEVLAETSGTVDLANSKLTFNPTTMTSSSVAFRADNVVVDTGDEFQVRGDIAFRGDIGRVMQWFADTAQPATQKLSGLIVGDVRLAHSATSTQATWKAKVHDFVLAKPAEQPRGLVTNVAAGQPKFETVWQEKELTIAGSGSYGHQAGSIELTQFDIVSPSLQLNSKGRVADMAGRCQLDVSGQVTYDFASLAKVLEPYLGSDVEIEGGGTREFSIKGPLWAATSNDPEQASPGIANELVATAGLGWKSANVYGMPVGEGDLSAQLSEGVVNFAPIDVRLSNGRLTTAPRIVLNTTPAVLVVDRGPLIDNVQLTPEICQQWLKFVAPLLANSTRAEGQFSVDLTGGAKLPLTKPTDGNIRGVLKIHAGRIGPGPVGQQLLQITKQLKAITQLNPLNPQPGTVNGLVTLPAQEVEFHMVDGRVHHAGLQVLAGGVLVRTSGSVGIGDDQSLDMIAEIPVRDEWVANNRLLAGLKGKTLQIPIRGSLTKPAADGRAVTNLTKQVIGGGVERVLEKELLKGLDGLFRQ